MIGFWHTYGALITVGLVLLSIFMVFEFSRRLLSAESGSEEAGPERDAPRPSERENS
jgi:hypothetical protein